MDYILVIQLRIPRVHSKTNNITKADMCKRRRRARYSRRVDQCKRAVYFFVFAFLLVPASFFSLSSACDVHVRFSIFSTAGYVTYFPLGPLSLSLRFLLALRRCLLGL